MGAVCFTLGDKTEHTLSRSVNDTKLGGMAAAASSGAGNHKELRSLGKEESYQVQQREVQGPAPGPALTFAWD